MVVIGGLLAPIGGKTPQNRLKRPDDTVVRPSRRRPRGFSTSSIRYENHPASLLLLDSLSLSSITGGDSSPLYGGKSLTVGR
jgi:hypothetical protein